jgi:hypothetical protein
MEGKALLRMRNVLGTWMAGDLVERDLMPLGKIGSSLKSKHSLLLWQSFMDHCRGLETLLNLLSMRGQAVDTGNNLDCQWRLIRGVSSNAGHGSGW